MERVRVSAIITTWNAGDVLGRCLESLRTQRVSGGFETLVVDNASTDDTASVLARHSDHVQAISNDHNLGFAAGNNQAAREARGDVLFFLNPDTEMRGGGVLERLASVVEVDGVGIAGPRLLNPDGSIQPSCAAYPGVRWALVTGAGLHRLLPKDALARIAPEHWSHDHPIDTDWLMGAAIAVPAALFRELGGFWPRMYVEEQDLAYRVRRRGLRVRFESSVAVMHVGGHSTSKRWSARERGRRVASAQIAFLKAHYAWPRALAIRTILAAAFLTRAAVLTPLGRHVDAAVYSAMARVHAGSRAARD